MTYQRHNPKPALAVDGPECDRIMEILGHRPGVTTKYLAEQVDRHRSSVKKLLEKMAEEGMVHSTVSASNRMAGFQSSADGSVIQRDRMTRGVTLQWWLT